MLLLHILQETWKMKARISRDIGYYTVFPCQGPAIFWLFLQKRVKATLWAQMGLRKRAGTGWEWAGDNFWKSDVAKRDNINRLKSNGSKMTSQIQLNFDLNLQAKWHTQCQDSSKSLSKDQNRGVGDSPTIGMILPLISIWNHPAGKN